MEKVVLAQEGGRLEEQRGGHPATRGISGPTSSGEGTRKPERHSILRGSEASHGQPGGTQRWKGDRRARQKPNRQSHFSIWKLLSQRSSSEASTGQGSTLHTGLLHLEGQRPPEVGRSWQLQFIRGSCCLQGAQHTSQNWQTMEKFTLDN